MRTCLVWMVWILVAWAVQPAAAEPAGQWFTPPAGVKDPHATVDVSPGNGVAETITVIGERPSRSWRSKLAGEHLNDPMASDAARPRQAFTPQQPYCNSALRTVGGQPANAAETMVGSGSGAC